MAIVEAKFRTPVRLVGESIWIVLKENPFVLTLFASGRHVLDTWEDGYETSLKIIGSDCGLLEMRALEENMDLVWKRRKNYWQSFMITPNLKVVALLGTDKETGEDVVTSVIFWRGEDGNLYDE